MHLDAEDVDAIARRVVAIIRDEMPAAPVRLVDAATLARALGVDRSWVYAHAKELHAIRLTDGHGRLRFDLDEVQRCLNGNGGATNGRPRTSRRRGVMDAGATCCRLTLSLLEASCHANRVDRSKS